MLSLTPRPSHHSGASPAGGGFGLSTGFGGFVGKQSVSELDNTAVRSRSVAAWRLGASMGGT